MLREACVRLLLSDGGSEGIDSAILREAAAVEELDVSRMTNLNRLCPFPIWCQHERPQFCSIFILIYPFS
ncbi:MAG: hypothetical protein SGPRY_007340 [Prymnesium sp.]